jgi:enamine deaminase RidA (YjgF/YER057c/UK114 family)
MDNKQKSVCIELFEQQAAHGVTEYHAVLHVTCPTATWTEQLAALRQAYRRLTEEQLPQAHPVFHRFYVSDAANQADQLRQAFAGIGGAVSIVQQAPLDGTKLALWVYLLTDVSVEPATAEGGLCRVSHGAYCHLWGSNAPTAGGSSHSQTVDLFETYASRLQAEGCTLADNCLRTWIYVQNIDVNYSGVVHARNEVFSRPGLTPDTHSIASTGICGRSPRPEVSVVMDTYAVKGISPRQVQYLYAPTHLNPTYEYGVSFERGTCVKYADRRQVFISGTASINNRGQVVHPGDIRRQTERMWQNVEALLAEAECNFSHVGQMAIYLRDVADYAVVEQMFADKFPHTPKVILLAPVCRPGWLIEMECMAVKTDHMPEFKPF